MERLTALRGLLRARGLSAYVTTTQDAHLSEYVGEADKRREWLTGFTGSSGVAVVTDANALLWTDGRYYEQAARELAPGWKLVRGSDMGQKSVPEYLQSELPPGARVGINPDTLSVATAGKWDKILAKGRTDCCAPVSTRTRTSEPCSHCCSLEPLDVDLVDEIWAERPPRPNKPIFVQPDELTGRSVKDKLATLRAEMEEEGADCIVIAALDEIAWLLNLRGGDILYTPVFYSYLVVTHSRVVLMVDPEAIKPVEDVLGETVGELELFGYNDRRTVLGRLDEIIQGASLHESRPKSVRSTATSSADLPAVWIDPEACSLGLQLDCTASGAVRVLPRASPVVRAKAIKTAAELEGMREAHKLEGAAFCKFMAWLEERVLAGDTIDELETVSKLEEFREGNAAYRGPSFETISAYGSNASVIHYAPTEATSNTLGTDSLFLCDTGGQYENGTTDMTRTVCFGEPTPFQKRCFSLVLQGHINVAAAIVPQGVEPAKMDMLARLPLWSKGLDYNHGTSHGLGAALGVHEYPPLMFSDLPAPQLLKGMASPTSMAADMVMSNEPGFYQPGEFGIRIESVMISRQCQDRLDYPEAYDANKVWLDFETITVIPLQRKMIDPELLSPEATRWVDEYQAFCLETLRPLLADDPRALAWLEREAV